MSVSPPVRLILVVPVRLYREGLERVLRDRGELEIHASVASVDCAVELLAEDPPDVVLLSTELGVARMHIRTLTACAPGMRVVALGVAGDDAQLVSWVEAGADGFVTSEASIEDLVDAVSSAARGEVACPPRLAAALVRRVAGLGGARASFATDRLTRREKQVADLLDHGYSNKEIARRLEITLATVKNHVHSILEKLCVTRRGEAVALLRRMGGLSGEAW
jgi:DNA-binding NarL/FixJ family response regulator